MMNHNSLKAESIGNLQSKLEHDLKKPHSLDEKESIVNSYLLQVEDILRHLRHEVKCVHNEMQEGFVFIAWIEQDDLFTHILNF